MIRIAKYALLLLITTPLFAQTNLKQHVQGRLGDAVDQHNEELQNAMNGNDSPAPPPTPIPSPAPAAANPDGTLPIKFGWLTRPSLDGKTKTRLYFAYPQSLSNAAPAPALLVIQEMWGVNEDLKTVTQDFAKHGFYVVAPDLYDGHATFDPEEAATLKAGLKNDVALINMKTGLDLIAEEEGNGVVDPNRVGVIGWDIGAQQALFLATQDPRIKATALFYGPLLKDPLILKNLQGPVLGIFGNDDKNPSPADVSTFHEALNTAGKTDVTIYQIDGVGHEFDSKSAAKMSLYNPEKAKEANNELWSWLNVKLLKK